MKAGAKTTKDGFFRHCYKLVKLVTKRFFCEQFTYHASALTFTTLLSIVPLMTVMLSTISAFPVFSAQGTIIQDFIFKNMIPASGDVIREHLLNFATHAGRLSLIGMGMLLVTSIILLLTIENSLNSIWHVKVGRRGVSALLRYWAVLSLAPLFIGASFVLTTHIFSLSFVAHATKFWGVKETFLSFLPFTMTFLGFTLLYTVVPNCRVKLRYGIIGGIFAAILFEAAKRGFALYVLHFPSYQLVYGAFAAIPIFLVWIYVSWVIILLGASMSHTVATVERTGSGSPIDGFTHAFLWLCLLWDAQVSGVEMSLSRLIKRAPWHYREDPEELMRALVDAGFVTVTEKGGYVLARAGEHIILKELYDRLPWPLPNAAQMDAMCLHHEVKYCHVIKMANECLKDSLSVKIVELYEHSSS